MHEPLSPCGMWSQHLDGAWLGFKFCCTPCIPPECHKTQQFLKLFCFSCWKHSMGQVHDFCLVQLEYVRHTPSINTGNCHELCKTWCVFACIGSWTGTHHGQHHIIILEYWQHQQLHISWILYTPTAWQLNARLLGASWGYLEPAGTSWD